MLVLIIFISAHIIIYMVIYINNTNYYYYYYYYTTKILWCMRLYTKNKLFTLKGSMMYYNDFVYKRLIVRLLIIMKRLSLSSYFLFLQRFSTIWFTRSFIRCYVMNKTLTRPTFSNWEVFPFVVGYVLLLVAELRLVTERRSLMIKRSRVWLSPTVL